nr:hypothetical protein [uncultured Draconibacterium sp.]
MKKILPKLKLSYILILGILLNVFSSFDSSAQIEIDGNFETDYLNEQFINLGTVSATCEVGDIYAAIVTHSDGNDYLVLGIHNGNNGEAIFRFFLDSEENFGTDSYIYKKVSYPVNDADRMLEIYAASNSFTSYTYDGTDFVAETNSEIIGLQGDYELNDGKFLEIAIPIGYFPSICNPDDNGNINLSTYIAFSGGGNSSVCGWSTLDFNIGLGGQLNPDTTVCSGENSTTLTLTGEKGVIDNWYFSTDSGTTWDPLGHTNNFYTAENLTQDTWFQVRVLATNNGLCNDGSENVELKSTIAKITVEECCTETVIAGDDFEVCENGMISLDATFSDNLNFASATWVGPNGFTSSSIDTAFIASSTDYSGEYIVTVDYGTDCISFDTVAVIVLPAYTGTDSDVICDSELPYTYGDSTFTAAGTKDVVFSTINGCDSIITFTLDVNPTYTGTDSDVICDSELPYTYGDSTFTAAGTKDVVFSTINGCDSIITFTLDVNPTYTGTDSDVICDSELPYTYGDSTFTAAGTKDVVFSTINGCDSIITFTLDVNPTYTGTDSDVICDSELPYTYGDSTFTAAGTKDVVFSTINGCDSIITFTLDVNPTYTGTDSDVICDSELPYTYGDSTFTAAGTKDVVFSTINGCDSIITFTLDVNPTYTGTDSDVICDSELPYTYGDSTFTAAGTKDVVFSTINGCDSIITFTLDVNPTYTGTDSDVICDSELPYTYGDSTFTAAGTKDVVFSTINGCDSIITFTLDVNPTYTGTDSDVICDSELPYTYGDSTFTAAGTKDVVFSTINGCDSIITFTLDVNPTYTGTDSDVICDSELPYTYGDSTFTAAGTKDVVFSTINGCDSIITFTLDVNPTYTGTDVM